MNPAILAACLSPLVVIWIVMKLALWLSATNEERNYVRAESKKPHGPYVADAYADVDEEEESMRKGATKLQANFRGYKDRKVVGEKKAMIASFDPSNDAM